MSPQETFNTVVSHLRQQGAKAVNPGGVNCRYRTEDGLKCAVGCLILNEEYSPKMEGSSVASILKYADDIGTPTSLVERLQPHLELLRRLQGVHDSCTVSSWEENLKMVADDFGLTYTPPETP